MNAKLLVAVGLAAFVAACSSGSSSSSSASSSSSSGGPTLRAPAFGPVPDLPEFEGDPATPEKVAIGTDMFFDARLSGSGHSTCNGCHLYLTGFQDNLINSVPDRSYPNDTPTLARNTLSFMNLAYAPRYRWDGSNTDLVDVMVFPFSEPNMNLGMDRASAQAKLKHRLTVDVPGYAPLFKKAFGVDLASLPPDEVWKVAGRALRAFVRKAVSKNSAFDKWNAGDDNAMSDAAKRGFALFDGKAKCSACHAGPFFTDFGFHNLSTSLPDPKTGKRPDEGRFLVTGKEEDRGAFITPTLREVYRTAPYFHDGSQASLGALIKYLASPAVKADPNHDGLVAEPLPVADAEIDDLVEFLGALRGEDVGHTITPPPPNTP